VHRIAAQPAALFARALRVAGPTPFAASAPFWGLADQAVGSLGSFVTMLLVARILGPAEFGGFALALSVLYFLNTLQVGLITRPHNVIGVTKEGEAYRRYTTSTALAQILFTVSGALLVGAAAIGAGFIHAGAATLLVALVPAIVTWQLQEFVRRVFYTEDRLADAFANDLINYAAQIALVLALADLGLLTGATALAAIAASSALALVLGAFKLRSSIVVALEPGAQRENWRFGKWVGAAEAAHWASTTVYLYIAAALLGTAAAGAIRAAQVLMGPLRIVLMFLHSFLPIRFARWRARGGRDAVHREARSAYAVTVPSSWPTAFPWRSWLRPCFGSRSARAT
jgi:O-antigen/teichoic acid export membrane protein